MADRFLYTKIDARYKQSLFIQIQYKFLIRASEHDCREAVMTDPLPLLDAAFWQTIESHGLLSTSGASVWNNLTIYGQHFDLSCVYIHNINISIYRTSSQRSHLSNTTGKYLDTCMAERLISNRNVKHKKSRTAPTNAPRCFNSCSRYPQTPTMFMHAL